MMPEKRESMNIGRRLCDSDFESPCLPVRLALEKQSRSFEDAIREIVLEATKPLLGLHIQMTDTASRLQEGANKFEAVFEKQKEHEGRIKTLEIAKVYEEGAQQKTKKIAQLITWSMGIFSVMFTVFIWIFAFFIN